MPIIYNSSYKAPILLRNADLQTVLTSKFRPYHKLAVTRKRLELPDGDFIDVDLHVCTAGQTAQAGQAGQAEKRAVIVSHGLEGNSTRRYMLGMATACAEQGWDVILRNFRGCSGEMNRLPHFYHGGETGDLDFVVRWAEAEGYETLVLMGFSMGGNQTLKYLGEMGQAQSLAAAAPCSQNSACILPQAARTLPEAVRTLPEAVRCAVTFSVPCDFISGAQKIDAARNAMYLNYFMKSLCNKIRQKAALFPDQIDITNLDTMRTFGEFDAQYTSPMFGFASALDYWSQASCKPYLPYINIPTLLVSSLDDPFLTPQCYPFQEARNSKHLFLEVPHHGGHVGFISINKENRFWSEMRAMEFVNEVL
ncbi:MAG: alpha/beta fold hydrolase [Pseudomonadota bacterium]